MQREFLIKERKHVMRNCAIEKKIASCILVVVTSFCLSRAATVSFRQWTGNAGDNDIAKHKNFNSADLADENLAIGGFPAGRYTMSEDSTVARFLMNKSNQEVEFEIWGWTSGNV